MVDVDTFLTALYVIADDFCHSRRPKKRPGPDASLSESEVILWPSSPGGAASPARGTSTATPKPPARRLPHTANSPPVQPARALLYGTHRADRLAPGDPPWGAGVPPTRRSIARRCPLGTASAGARGGWPDMRTSVGPTASDGTKASACSPRSTLPGSSLASVSRSASTADQRLAETFFAVRASAGGQAHQRGIGCLGTLRGRQGFRGQREPPKMARSIRSSASSSAQTQLSQEELPKSLCEKVGWWVGREDDEETLPHRPYR